MRIVVRSVGAGDGEDLQRKGATQALPLEAVGHGLLRVVDGPDGQPGAAHRRNESGISSTAFGLIWIGRTGAIIVSQVSWGKALSGTV